MSEEENGTVIEGAFERKLAERKGEEEERDASFTEASDMLARFTRGEQLTDADKLKLKRMERETPVVVLPTAAEVDEMEKEHNRRRLRARNIPPTEISSKRK